MTSSVRWRPIKVDRHPMTDSLDYTNLVHWLDGDPINIPIPSFEARHQLRRTLEDLRSNMTVDNALRQVETICERMMLNVWLTKTTLDPVD